MKTYKIGIIGSGNMAFSLGKELLKTDFTITEVSSRNKREGKKLAALLEANFIANLTALKGDAELYFLCLQDDAIATAYKQFPLSGKTVVHTSGTISMSVLSGKANRYGVFYPVQSINKNISIDWKETPLCVEASDGATLKILNYAAKKISGKVYKIDSEQRKHLHLAAVFANNFSNACFSMANALINESGLSFDLLRPLILNTATKVQTALPDHVQTGPAKRHDEDVLKVHRKLLQEHPELRKVYQLMTTYIQQH